MKNEEDKHILYLLKNETLSYFKLRSFTKEENKLLLHLAILNNKIQLVKYLVNKGEKLNINKELLQQLVSKPKYVRLLSFLEEEGINLLKIGENKMIKLATLNFNVKGLQLLMKYITEENKESLQRFLYLSIMDLFSNYTDENKKNSRQLNKILNKGDLILELLLSKTTEETYQSIMESLKEESFKTLTQKIYLDVNLNSKSEISKYKI